MTLSRLAVGGLGGVAAAFAGLVGAVSLTRIAGDYLGFPTQVPIGNVTWNLAWTLTGSVDVASIAGGIMWTAFSGPVRKIGRPMNIVCTVVSGLGVGLDHATHSPQDGRWPWIAFAAGLFVPALATWILHALSIIFDTAGHQPAAVDRQRTDIVVGSTADQQATHVTIRQAAQNRQLDQQRPTNSAVGTGGPTALSVGSTNSSGRTDRQPHAVDSASPPPVVLRKPSTPPPGPSRQLRMAPVPRPPWMTEDLLRHVVAAMAAAFERGETYGAPRLMKEHRLSDGDKITRHKADAVLAHVEKHRLLEEAS